MNPERFRQIRELFEAARQHPCEDRSEFVASSCSGDLELYQEVTRLLDSFNRAKVFLDHPPLLTGTPDESPDWEGRRIGAYQLVHRLGQGGMGTVYLARRADAAFNKQVAVKIVRPTAAITDVLRRFQQEREVLAELDHPNIARLLDGGSTEEGWPYFVMEYVAGVPIDQYCDANRLTVRERVRLFEQVCEAVDYAHKVSVVHRDLKPGNILVTDEGVVKLLDFGISKVLSSSRAGSAATETRNGMQLLTLEYASPEQVNGDGRATAATDVYSLGVVLYELLTGRRPFQLAARLFSEVVSIVCEQEPTRPSTAVAEATGTRSGDRSSGGLTPAQIGWRRGAAPEELKRQLAGDLDNILLKTLRKQPPARYASATSLREDLQRYRDGLPIKARPASRIDRTLKLVRRHPLTVAAVAALGILTAGGAVTIHWTAVLFCIFFSVTLGLGYVAVRIDRNRTLAEKRLPVFVLLLVILLGSPLLITQHLPPPRWQQLVTVPELVALLAFMYLVLRWPWRARWAGSLLLDLQHSPARGMQFIAGVMLAGVTLSFIAARLDSRPITTYEALHGCTMVVLAVSQLMLHGRLEIRQRGALIGGEFVQWAQIVSYTWESGDTGYLIVRVQVRRWFGLLLPMYWTIPAERRDELDGILGWHTGWEGAPHLHDGV